MADPVPVLLDGFDEDEVFDAMLCGVAKRLAASAPIGAQPWVYGRGILIEAAGIELLGGDEGRRLVSFHAQESLQSRSHVDGNKVAAAAWRLVTSGLGHPRFSSDNGFGQASLVSVVLTARGIARLSHAAPDGPGRPGHLARLMTKHPDIAEEVFARLQDAQACLDAELHRPAIVMLGIAAEVTTDAAHRACAVLGLAKGTMANFRDGVATVQAALQHMPESEDRHRLRMALDAIETVRGQRNDAAHPGHDVPDHAVVLERFGSMCLHLPVVWEALVLPNRS